MATDRTRAAILNAAEQLYAERGFSEVTLRDIVDELRKPGRDPRPEFKTATFQEGVEDVKDLQPGMILEGVVTNVAAFGAFVDIGVHQDGLVHISALADRYVKDPHSVAKAGQIVKVKVLEVDAKRKRIALTMRLADTPAPAGSAPRRTAHGQPAAGRPVRAAAQAPVGGAMAAAFAKLKR